MINLVDLNLNTNQLSGNIPSELGNLISLNTLWLFGNKLSGSIPPELGNLANLQILHLWSNKLSGSIPAELGDLNNLTEMILFDNQLSGNIPLELGNLPNLNWLFLAANQLSGNIPPELGSIQSLTWLVLGSNQLSGNIPADLENLQNLTWLSLDNNQLSGTIPTELGNLTNLTELDLFSNQLSGSIPAELGSLTNLNILYLQDNLLDGDIPPTFVQLINLFDPGENNGQDGLDLDYNRLNIPPGYPDPGDPLQVFLNQKDPDWQLYQGFEQVIGSLGGELSSLDGSAGFVIPAGAVEGETTFTFLPQPAPNHDHPGLVFAHNSFVLTAEDADGNPVMEFNTPVTLTLTYTDADFGLIAEESLGLYYWDEAASAWTDAVATCPGGEYTRDLEGNILELPLCHLTEFGLFGEPLRIFLPLMHR